MHTQGVLHLDLKPENVMITRVGNAVKVIDFGCAYCSADDSTSGFTLEYRAPEQENGTTNAYTDIYLIGRIMEELTAHADCRRPQQVVGHRRSHVLSVKVIGARCPAPNLWVVWKSRDFGRQKSTHYNASFQKFS